MARIAYECNQVTSNNMTNTSGILKPFSCTDKSCIYCCCNAQCCLIIQRKPPKHFWEAWYFWIGVAILILFIISSVSNYLLVNYRQIWMTLPFVSGQSIGENNHRINDNISIHVIPIPTTDDTSTTNKKLFLTPPESSISHMTPIVA